MNTIRLMITALMAAGAIACFAEPAVESSPNATKPEAPKAGNGPRRPRMEQRSREARPARPEGENRRREMWVGEGRDGLVGQSMMLRMLDRPETRRLSSQAMAICCATIPCVIAISGLRRQRVGF